MEWISVKNRLPESGQCVAVYSEYFYSIGVWKRYIDTVLMKNFSGKYDRVKVLREEWFVLTEDGDEVLVDDDRVKYWCELPELPENEQREMKEWFKRYGVD